MHTLPIVLLCTCAITSGGMWVIGSSDGSSDGDGPFLSQDTPKLEPATGGGVLHLSSTSLQASNTFAALEGIVDYLNEVLPMVTISPPTHEPSWSERYQMVYDGDIEIGWMCPRPYAQQMLGITRERSLVHLAAPVWDGDRYGGRPVYFSYLITHRDHHASTLEHLSGASVAFNSACSQSGYCSIVTALEDAGLEPEFFSRWVHSGSHAASMELVARGEVTTAAIDSTIWDHLSANTPHAIANLKIAHVLGPYPSPPLVAHMSVPLGVRNAITHALLRLHRNTTHPHDDDDDGVVQRYSARLKDELISRFVMVDDEHFKEVGERRCE